MSETSQAKVQTPTEFESYLQIIYDDMLKQEEKGDYV